MKFLVPFTIGSTQAEQIYERSKRQLEAIGFRVADARIQQLAFHREGELLNQQVGNMACNGEIIAAILHSDVGYFVCTFTEVEPTGPIPIWHTQLIIESRIVVISYFENY